MNEELLAEARRRGLIPPDQTPQVQAVSPQVNPELLAEAKRRGLVPDERGFGQKIADAWKGNATEDLKSLDFYQFQDPKDASFMQSKEMQAAQLGLSSIFGSDEDKQKKFLELVPSAKLSQDANGNPVIETDQGRFYVNKPGMDAMDVSIGAVKGAMFTPAAKIASLGGSLLAKIGLGAAASGATDAGMQAAAERSIDEYDPKQTLATAAFGGAGELAAPVLGAVGRGVKRIADRFKSPESLIQVGKQLAEAAGIPGTLDDGVYIALAKKAGEIKGGASVPSILSEAELGTTLTKGQKTGDYAQRRLEEMLKNRPDGAGAVLRDAESSNQQALQEAAAKLRANLGADTNPVDAAQLIQRSVQEQHGNAKKAVAEAYDLARSKPAAVPDAHAAALPARARDALADFDLSPDLHPAATRALDLLERKMGAAKPAAEPGALAGTDLRSIETTRKQLSSLVDSAKNPADRAATIRVKKELDSWLDDAVDSSIITGDVEAINALKEARSLRTKLHQRFEQSGPSDQAGRIVQKMIKDEASPDQIAQMVFGAGHLSPAAGANVARKLKSALGDDAEAWNAVRGAILAKATTNKVGETAGPQAIVTNLKDLLRNRKTLMNELYSPQERDAISRFTMMVEPLVKKGDLAKSSGTAERLMAALSSGFGNVPVLGSLMNAIAVPRRFIQASGALQPIRDPSAFRVPGAVAAAAYQNQAGQ